MDTMERRDGPARHRGQVVALLVLAPICAEYLAAYDDTTGDPLVLLAGLLVFVPLYGAPALIVREVARRAGLGWIGIILGAATFGLLEAGVIDQSLFSPDYRGIESLAEASQATWVQALGLSGFMAQSFVIGHVIFSFCAPIALVEAFRPERRDAPWLGPTGLAIAAAAWLASAVLVLGDHLSSESSHASPAQLAAALAVAGLLVVGAFVLGRRRRAAPPVSRRARRPRTILLASLIAVSAITVVPETWLGFALAGGLLVLAGALLVHASRASGWDARHDVAVAAGALLSRALLAFTYDPVIGDVSASRKYLHNVAFAAIIAVICLVAARRAGSRPPRGGGAGDPAISRPAPTRAGTAS